MGKYDINAQLEEGSKPTLEDLCNELCNELCTDEETCTQYSTSEMKFKMTNSQDSGLINKLKKYLNFDLEEMAGVSVEERFDELKLLKALFYIEKVGRPKKDDVYGLQDNIKIHIINILSKPRLSNIKSYYSNGSQYGKIFTQFFDSIKSVVADADERIVMIDSIDAYWQYLSQRQFDYVFSNMALSDMESSLKELQRINGLLESILDKIDTDHRDLHMSNEGIMKTFFNILLTHRQLCYETDRIKAAEYIDMDISPDTKYTTLFREFEYESLKITSIGLLKSAISWKDKPRELYYVFNLLSYCKDIPTEDYKHYKYAFDHVQTVLNWIMKEKEGTDYSEEVPLALLVSVVQEIVYIKKNNKKFMIRNDFYGYQPKNRSLLSALKTTEDEVDSVLEHIWIRRIETRFSINYGAHDLITEKNRAELLMYRIKEFLYGYRNLNDLRLANSYIIHMMGIAHTNTSIAAKGEYFFQLWLTHHLDRRDTTIDQFVLPDDPQNIYDMFSELSSAYGPVVNAYINDLAEQIADTIVKNSDDVPITHTFKIYNRDDSYRECYLDFKFSKADKKFFYNKFSLIYSAADEENLRRLGLEKLILIF